MSAKVEVRKFVRGDPVLVASLVLALLSMLVVTPSADYLDYIDVRTLVILLALMAVVAAISSLGTFDRLARRMLEGSRGIRSTCAVLVALPFFLSMFITNDVALLTFVPFAIIVLGMAERKDLVIPVLVLQTLAANLGSMLLPFGNPQNIFISSRYGAGLIDFMTVTGPLVLMGAVFLLFLVCRVKGGCGTVGFEGYVQRFDRARLAVLMVLFLICILAVVRTVPYEISVPLVLLVVVLVSPRTLLRVDWGLLLTFVFLFIFAGNLASVDSVRSVLDDLMSWDPVVTSALVSQFISNVPATVMLSNFTSCWDGLLAGVNLGGFGTPIASMASIITLRIYSRENGSDRVSFLRFFTIANVVMLVLLLIAGSVLFRMVL